MRQIRCLITFWVESSIISIAILQITSSGRSLMYGRKSVGPRMDPWGIPASTGYYCEDFPSRTIRSCLLMRKEEISPNSLDLYYEVFLLRLYFIFINLPSKLELNTVVKPGLILLTIMWNPGVPCSKPLGGSKIDSAFHPSDVDKMSTRNFWELSGKK